MCACMTASIIPGALETKRKSDAIYVNYLDCMGIIKNAKAANNLSMLVQLTDKAAIFRAVPFISVIWSSGPDCAA